MNAMNWQEYNESATVPEGVPLLLSGFDENDPKLGHRWYIQGTFASDIDAVAFYDEDGDELYPPTHFAVIELIP